MPMTPLMTQPVCCNAQGCLGMKLGEVRKLNIPADEGYGAGGFPAWGIPAGGTLDFEIEVLKIAGGKTELR